MAWKIAKKGDVFILQMKTLGWGKFLEYNIVSEWVLAGRGIITQEGLIYSLKFDRRVLNMMKLKNYAHCMAK